VSQYISQLSNYPPKTVIVDLGCGDATLARALIPKGMTVLSFDLVSDGAYVVEADICGTLPLPGSEVVEAGLGGEGHVADVVVCALSLMGTNWPNCIREAWRVLKLGYVAQLEFEWSVRLLAYSSGELKIAEVASRFKDVDKFISLIRSIGFQLVSKVNMNL
jgi:ribosomal RNA-processing protein 8